MTVGPLAVAIGVWAVFSQAGAGPYAWPLDLPRELTSSFGEHRPGRYHMGIDLRTGPIGQNVYAADDGYVMILSCSPYGYGKGVYLRLNDGNFVVYAHLDEFMPPLADYVRRAQHANRSYSVRVELKPGELPVKRGQLIAKSGQTGIGVPHLHYEFRDAAATALNPGLLGVDWPDDTAPVFRKVAIIPIEPDSTVHGDVMPVVRDVRLGPDGRYTADELRASGPFAVAVAVFDPAPGGSKLGVYRLTAGLNGRQKFQITHDRLSYENDDDGAAAYEPALSDRGQFLLLWRKPGNESENYPQHGEDGRIELAISISEVLVVAEDFHGNRAELAIPARPEFPEDPPAPKAALIDRTDTGRGEVAFDYTGVLFIATARFETVETVTPVLHVGGATPERVPMRRVGPREFRVAYRPAETFADANVNVEHPRIDSPPERIVFMQRSEEPLPWQIDLGPIRLRPYSTQPYGLLPIRVRTIDDIPSHPELTPVSAVIELWPTDAVVDGALALRMPLPPDSAEHVLVYRQTREGWDPLTTHIDGDDLMSGSNQLGIFALMKDSVAPEIRVIRPAAGAVLTSRRPELRAEIRDGGSGIDEFTGTFNGTWLLMEYDPEQDLLIWEQDEDLPPGAGRLTIEVTDRAGNVSSRETDLTVPD